MTRWFFVMIATGLRNSARTSRQRRVIRSFLSIGWYGSVTPDSTMTWGFQRGLRSAFRSSSGARSLTSIRLSKSSPAEKPRYSWVGRA